MAYIITTDKNFVPSSDLFSWSKKSCSSEVVNIWVIEKYFNQIEIVEKSKARALLLDGYSKHSAAVERHAWMLQQAEAMLNGDCILDEYSGIFNLMAINNETGAIHISNDPSGLFPLYYVMKDLHFYAGSHMHLLGLELRLDPDHLGLLQKIHYGYSIGDRTYYQGLSRLNPGEILSYKSGNVPLELKQGKSYYSGAYIKGAYSDEVFKRFSKIMSLHRKRSERIGIMLSEGFDSRFIGGLARNAGFKINCFTHGTSGTKGSEITRRIATLLGASYQFEPLLNGFTKDEDSLKEQLLLADNLNVVFWIKGAEFFRDQTEKNVLACGTALDATLGGHIFYLPSRNKWKAVFQRYTEIMMQNFGMVSDAYIENLSAQLLNQVMIKNTKQLENKIRGIYNLEVAEKLKDYIPLLNQSVTLEFDRLNNSGSSKDSQVLQRFFFEHRARKFSFGQELTLRMYNEVIVPSAEFSFLEFATKIHPKEKLHHKLYLKVLNQHMSFLQEIENGGFGLKANKPRWILESSRFFNRWKDNKYMKAFMEKKGGFPASKFRPVLVAEVNARYGDTLNILERWFSKNSEIIRVDKQASNIEKVRSYQRRSFNLDFAYDIVEQIQVLEKK